MASIFDQIKKAKDNGAAQDQIPVFQQGEIKTNSASDEFDAVLAENAVETTPVVPQKTAFSLTGKIAAQIPPSPQVVNKPIPPKSPPSVSPTIGEPKPASALKPKDISVTALANIELGKVDTNTFDRGAEKFTEAEVQEIRDNIEFIKSNFEHVDLIKDAFRALMISLKANPNLEGILSEEDIGSMVRVIRQQRIVHVATGEKKVETRGKGKVAQANMDDAFAAILAANGLDSLA